MEGYEVEELIADHYNRLWEEMNDVPEEDPEEEPEEEVSLYGALDQMDDALNDMETVVDLLQGAADDAEGHPLAARILAVLKDAKEVNTFLKSVRDMVYNEIIRREESA